MARDPATRRTLPERPSSEHLRKQAKRLARARRIKLAEAQRLLAEDYGFPDWPSLARHVREREPRPVLSELSQAARSGDLGRLRRLLAQGADAAETGETNPVWEACSSSAAPEVRLAMVEALLAAGADAREAVPGQRPLHAVAARGPTALARLLIRHGAIEWEPDAKGRSALDIARRAETPDRAELVHLLDRPVIDDPSFLAAVAAVQSGDVPALARLLDAEPRLLTERIREPDCYRESGRSQYFLDPKLFWFVANNPTLVETPSPALPEIARLMIARSVPQEDLDQAMGLVMTSSSLRQAGLQIPMVTVLMEGGASVDPTTVGGALAHSEREAVEHLVDLGLPLTPAVAAALDRLDDLERLLPSATQAQKDEALDLAVINNRLEAARMALAAGATVDRKASHHAHSQPLHQAALHDNVELVALLIAHGARTDAVDALWGGTPLGWAWHGKNKAVYDYLEALGSG